MTIPSSENRPSDRDTQFPPPSSSRDSGSDDSRPRAGEVTSIFSASDECESGEQPRLQIGERIGRYEITALLGAGGMGVVYKAHDELIDRDVAVKVLSGELAANETALKRFLAEAQASGKLNHPHAVAIYEIGREGNTHYLVMELAPGGSVASRLQRGKPLPVLEATRFVADACEGLAAAHAAGIVHRDMKPANLLLGRDGTVKVADFGLAKPTVSENRQVTQAGQVVGSPYFMSPEQCEAGPVDHRSDIYSLGATYYSLLTGTNPYEAAGSTVRILYAHCQGDVLNPRDVNATVPEACAAIVARAMAKRPEDRYQSAGEMLADLQAVFATLSGAGIQLPSLSGTRTAISGVTQVIPRSPTPPASRSRVILFATAGGLLLLGLVVAWAVFWKPGNNSQSTAGGGAAAGAPVAPSGPPIKVGVLQSLSGTMATSGSAVVDATLLAIEELNRSGGVLGRPIEAVVRDGSSDPEIFAREAESLITKDQVCTIFGCWTSSGRKMVTPIVERYDNLLVYPVQYEGLEESPNVIYLGATPNQQIIPAVKWAYAFLNKRRAFLVGSDYVFPRTANEIIKDHLRELGFECVGERYEPLGSTEFAPVAAAIVEAKPDVIFNSINGDSNIAFFRELRKAGIHPSDVATISFSIGEEELRHLNVAEMAGDYASWNYFQSIDSDANRQFVKHFKEKYGPQRVVTDPMESAYVGVKLWAAGVQDAGSAEAPAIRHAIRGQRLAGPGGDIRLDSATQHAFKTPRIGKITPTGQFEVIWTAAQPEAPQPFPPQRSAEAWKIFLHDLYRSWGQRWSAPAN